ncbi:MAG: hypothetical protein M3546_01280 [Actinomycetota bacterium]|nr:hypothetical protein [Actinomycetota bacterium]
MSDARFTDGLRYRVEIPSVEGPVVFRAVLEEAKERGVAVRRVSQGSGVMMLTDAEISEMAELGAEHGIEVSRCSLARAELGILAGSRSPPALQVASLVAKPELPPV